MQVVQANLGQYRLIWCPMVVQLIKPPLRRRSEPCQCPGQGLIVVLTSLSAIGVFNEAGSHRIVDSH